MIQYCIFSQITRYVINNNIFFYLLKILILKNTTGIFILFIFLTFSLVGQNSYQNSLKDCAGLNHYESQQCMLDKPVFDFTGTTYKGDSINLSALKGKILVLNFWFMACTPCMAELEGLNEIVDEYEQDAVEFISFTWDSSADLERDFFPNHTFKFKIISDAQAFIIEDLKLGWGFPTTFIVNQQGMIHKIFSGGETEKAAANAAIKKAIVPELDKLLERE